jgi:hypothetical protein
MSGTERKGFGLHRGTFNPDTEGISGSNTLFPCIYEFIAVSHLELISVGLKLFCGL